MTSSNSDTVCILTGIAGENPDDCTTHSHEVTRNLAWAKKAAASGRPASRQRVNTYEVKLVIITEAETPEEALDNVRSSKWTWTVTDIDTDETTELDA